MFNSDLFNFPFHAGVWGNAADWAMVCVTAFTLYYLRKTLKSQLRVQEAQLRITNIENDKYVKLNAPKFRFEVSNYTSAKGLEEYESSLSVEIVLIQSSATDCRILPQYNSKYITAKEDNIYNVDKVEENSTHYIYFDVKINNENTYETPAIIDLTCHFTDPVGNLYYQICSITILDDKTKVECDDKPTLITTRI